MSVIHIKQIQQKIRDLFASQIDMTDINPKDQEKENKMITRCLAAYAIYSVAECSIKDAALSVVDGGDDNGIDAIYYSPMYKRLFIVQSKFSKNGIGEPNSDDIAKFCRGVKDLFNLELDRFNSKISEKRFMIEKATNEYETHYTLIFIDTYASQILSKHSDRHINDLLSELNYTGDDSSEPIITFMRLNQGHIYSSLAQKLGNTPINIEMGLSQWGFVSEPYKAYYGMVSGVEIANWWKEHKNRLFDRNIRQVLGKTEVNDEIEKTIKEHPLLFWYYNNGITIIANKIEKTIVGSNNRELGSFKLTNLNIVNGAQTVSTIGKYSLQNPKNTKIESIKVLVRIIQLSDAPENFGNEVTKSNNRQNRIENRDFVSQDPEQIRIKTELLIDGINYNIMRSEFESKNEKTFGLLEATAALACASNKVSLAVLSKASIGRFFENLEKGVYREIFNPQTSGYYVYNCVKINRIIENHLWNKISKIGKRSGKKYLLLVHGNRMVSMLTISSLFTSELLTENTFNIDKKVITDRVDLIVSKMEMFVNKNYQDNLLATVFKNVTKCSEIEKFVKSELKVF